ncbi:hypothetical protein [Nocardia huaxiensis]|uniref:Uncharacterized protein n=1 Tax=Nocardia huaxiensis TaxID=2755382 RepID=A0A7D6VFK6_9NOCA|nr:hypothetical protein [Nocardia huaxiensis]QLY33913.1 hypothetical protein H0264_18255 [Nocardia huaxiensis]UFS99153.1 hypothetical protein LPY97_15260 [Nocardia huaxiensis]
MDLKAWLLRRAAITPYVVTAPGGTATRLAVEAACRAADWTPAHSPAAANLLVVAGRFEEPFAAYAHRIHNSMPRPRLRVDIPGPDTAADALAAAAERLRSGDSDHPEPEPAVHHGGDSHAGHTGHDAHEDHMGGMHDHGGHGMGMALPGGLAMADRAEDRDGLRLDVLNVPLGPVLAWWPAGLVVDTRLQGDIVSGATVSVLEPAVDTESFWLGPWLRAARGEQVSTGEAGRWLVARRLDSAADLLAVAGWADEARAAQRMRDDALSGELWPQPRNRRPLSGQDGAGAAAASRADFDVRLDRWARRVSRSRLLRWSLRGIGRIPDARGVPSGLAGDAHDRLRWLIDGLVGVDLRGELPLEPGGFVAAQMRRTDWIIEALPALLTGAELGEARLIVASLGPDQQARTRTTVEAADG